LTNIFFQSALVHQRKKIDVCLNKQKKQKENRRKKKKNEILVFGKCIENVCKFKVRLCIVKKEEND